MGRPPKQVKAKAPPAAVPGAQPVKGKPKAAKPKAKNQPVQAGISPVDPPEEEVVPPEEEYDTDELANLPTDSETESEEDQNIGSSGGPEGQ